MSDIQQIYLYGGLGGGTIAYVPFNKDTYLVLHPISLEDVAKATSEYAPLGVDHYVRSELTYGRMPVFVLEETPP